MSTKDVIPSLKGVTRDQFASRFRYDPETGQLFRTVGNRWGVPANRLVTCRTASGYLKVTFDRIQFVAHRVIWLLSYNEVPDKIDHINGDGTDNRLSNLRACTQAQNRLNSRRRSDNTSGFKGVSFARDRRANPWVAKIQVGRKAIHLGYHETKEEAAAAYAAAAPIYHGEFARVE